MINNTLATKPEAKLTIKALVLLIAPTLTYWIFQQNYASNFTINDISSIKLVFLLFWSPLFFSIPALLMQKSRDSYQSEVKGLLHTFKRGLTLIPGIIAKKNQASFEMAVSLVGYALLIALVIYLG
jgi:hypothetical protein